MNVRNRLVFKSVRFQKDEPLVLEQRVDEPNFIFVYLMAAPVSDWLPVTKLVCQRLAILAIIKNQKLVKLTLTELEPHFTKNDFVYLNSMDQVFTSVVDGYLELWH